MPYQMRRARRTDLQGSVFRPEYEFRMLDAIKNANSSDPGTCRNGLFSELLQKDSSRTTFLLATEDWEPYLQQLSTLDGSHYVQGDLNGSSDQTMVQSNTLVNNVRIHEQSGPISLELCYLRNDGTLGGVTLLWDPIMEGFSITVAAYPLNPHSYNDALITYFFHEKLATQAFVPLPQPFPNLTALEMLDHLYEALDNPRVFQCVRSFIVHKDLITVQNTCCNNRIFKNFTTKKSVFLNVENVPTEAELAVISYDTATKALELANWQCFFDRALELLTQQKRPSVVHFKKIGIVKKALTICQNKTEEAPISLEDRLTKSRDYCHALDTYQYLELSTRLLQCRITTEAYLAHLQKNTCPNTLVVQKIILIQDALAILNEPIADAQNSCSVMARKLTQFKEVLSVKDQHNQIILTIRRDSGFMLFVKGLGTLAATVFGLGFGGYCAYQRFFKVAGADFLKALPQTDIKTTASFRPSATPL
ncbi:MAG: hypothetical protein H2069_05100 [Legionella sp.]|nr:hypothetical protein [Legionella sp.]